MNGCKRFMLSLVFIVLGLSSLLQGCIIIGAAVLAASHNTFEEEHNYLARMVKENVMTRPQAEESCLHRRLMPDRGKIVPPSETYGEEVCRYDTEGIAKKL